MTIPRCPVRPVLRLHAGAEFQYPPVIPLHASCFSLRIVHVLTSTSLLVAGAAQSRICCDVLLPVIYVL